MTISTRNARTMLYYLLFKMDMDFPSVQTRLIFDTETPPEVHMRSLLKAAFPVECTEDSTDDELDDFAMTLLPLAKVYSRD